MASASALAALRELGVPLGLGRLSLRRIYRLDVSELRSVLQSATKRRISDKQVWDAMLYRAAILRTEFGPLDLALTVGALAKIRRRDSGFLGYLLEEVRAKAHAFVPRDAALLLNALSKLGHRDELLCRSLLPPVLRRTSEKTRWEDLALLALACARLEDPGREAICNRIVASLTPRIDKLTDGHALSLLACAFARPRSGASSAAAGGAEAEWRPQPLFSSVEAHADSGSSFGRADIAHLAFLEVLLQQCELHMFNFRGADVLHLCLALASLGSCGHGQIVQPRLLRRLERRLQELYFELRPAQVVRLLDVVEHIPDLERRCVRRLLDEAAYVARELTARSCLNVLRACARVGGHAAMQSAAAWRLARFDGPLGLTVPEVLLAAEMLAAVEPPLWECREAMLILLQTVQKRRQEPEPDVLAGLLMAFGTAAVRDTHWHHISAKLHVSAADPDSSWSGGERGARLHQADIAAAFGAEEMSSALAPVPALPFSQDTLADATLGLARLRLPELVDSGALFSRAAMFVNSAAPAARVLEAAGIFDLIARRPQDLTPDRLKPLIALVHDDAGGVSADTAATALVLPTPLRLFAHSDVAALACVDNVLQAWQTAVARGPDAGLSWPRGTFAASSSNTKESTAMPIGADRFALSVGQELSSWGKSVGLASPVQIGPLSVPWACSLSGLSRYLESNPLDGSSSRSSMQAYSSSRGMSRGSGIIGTRARRRRRFSEAAVPGDAAASEETDEDSKEHDATLDSSPHPETHILIELLRERDFYHASDSIRAEGQRARGQVLRAERQAEVRLLLHRGWHVVCIPEHLWTFPSVGGGSADALAASQANKALFFGLVATLGEAE
eukprot:TRINITY_DN4121_c0_g3_i1.p1 TRINITY_DN4121_c0_g3~~TRINITY_DN4121_c0_g3_i1.p1  ORF type:complete len:868 (-),score=152.94 TRINITY_DN4121_c0_g3_i1:148-2697(-)